MFFIYFLPFRRGSTVVRVFTNVLEQSLAQMEKNFNRFEKTLNHINQEKQKIIPMCLEGTEIKDKTIKEIAESIKALKDLIKELKQQQSGIVTYSDNMSLEDWARYIVHVEPTSFKNLVEADPNSNAPIFMEQKQISQNQDVSVYSVGQNPATQSDPSQQTNTKKEVMYGFIMIASPFLAAGIYSAVIYSGLVGTVAFNPDIAIGIFIGVAVIALALFVTVKKVCEKQKENPDMGTPPTSSGANLSSLDLCKGMTHGI